MITLPSRFPDTTGPRVRQLGKVQGGQVHPREGFDGGCGLTRGEPATHAQGYIHAHYSCSAASNHHCTTTSGHYAFSATHGRYLSAQVILRHTSISTPDEQPKCNHEENISPRPLRHSPSAVLARTLSLMILLRLRHRRRLNAWRTMAIVRSLSNRETEILAPPSLCGHGSLRYFDNMYIYCSRRHACVPMNNCEYQHSVQCRYSLAPSVVRSRNESILRTQ